MRNLQLIEPNGMPAFAGMTALFVKSIYKNHRHAREGGHPIMGVRQQ